MLQKILFINPIETESGRHSQKRSGKRKVKGKAMAKKRRSAKQKANDKKLGAMARARHAGGKKITRKKRKSSKVKKHSRNPVVHSMSKKRKTHSRRRKHSRNPIKIPKLGGIGTQLNDVLIPSVLGAVGAVGTDVVMAYLPIPAQFKTGNGRFVFKSGVAVLLGFAAGKVLGKQRGHAMGVGMLTSVFHDALRENLTHMMPTIKMDSVVNQAPAVTQAAAVGAATNAAAVQGLGYFNAAQVVDGMSEYVNGFDQPNMGEFGRSGMSEYVSAYDDRGDANFAM